MDTSRLRKIGRLFRQALELDSEARTIFLEEACAQDSELRREVETLLHDDSGSVIAKASTLHGGAQQPARAPAQIGNYRVLHQIGEGGMGEVYLAEQERPIRRSVALKIVRQGLESKQVIARFESERQALAMMDHPNIARVYDAGTTDEGRPYFVMEYVDGVPITDYCDEYRLTTRDRLELLIAVCEGLQHAHQKAVIHRDIKPSNVMITVKNEKPMPKIIDFGIAKATAQRLTERTLFTEFGQLIGTPEYMSPEQAQLTGEHVDTRTDIYSLGVLMYELLVGVLPFDPEDLRQGGFEEILRRIREDDPPRPSTRLSTAAEDRSTNTARRRRTSTNRLTGQLRGDLDWITMKALDKDRTRRYRSAAELADDIGRYLRNEPVTAGPPSAVYRMSKFVRRHRFGVGTAAALVTLLVAFSIVSVVQATRIARERDRANDEANRAAREAETARQVSDFMVDLFKVSDPGEARGNTVTAREILDAGAVRLGDLDGQPLTQAAFMETIGRVYNVMHLFDAGRPLLEEAVEIREEHAGEDEMALASSLAELALLYNNAGMSEEAEPVIRRAIEMLERLDMDQLELAEALNTLGNVVWHLERLDEAEIIHRRALAIREAALGPDDHAVAVSLHNIGALRYFAGDYDEAVMMWQRSAEIEEAASGPDSYGLATSLHTLAIVYSDQGRLEEALELELRSLAIREKVFGPDHPHVALSLTTLGNIYRGRDDPQAAEPHIRRAVDIAERKWGPTHGEVWWMRRNLGRTLNAMGRYDQAEQELTSLIATIEEAGDETDLPMNLGALGDAYVGQKRYDEAEATYRRAMAILEADEDEGEESPYVGLMCSGLANALREQDRMDEAEASYKRAIRLIEATWGEDDRDRMRAVRDYAELLRRTGREDEAAELEVGAAEPGSR